MLGNYVRSRDGFAKALIGEEIVTLSTVGYNP